MICLLVVMIWEISLVLAFVAGSRFKGKKRPAAESKSLTEEEKRAFGRMLKEQENFMNYDGTPQDAINDYD